MPDFWEELSGGQQGLPSGDPFAQQLADLYHKYGRHDPTPAEIQAHRSNPGGMAAIEQLLQTDNTKATNAAGAATPLGPTTFGATPAPYVPPSGIVDPTQQRTDYVANQFTEVAPGFTAPTDVTMQNDPGYLFRINQVRQQGERMAAAKGTVLNAGTVAAINDRVGDQATSEFNNVFARGATTFDKALQTYGAKYQTFLGNEGLRAQAANMNNGAIGANNAANASANAQNNATAQTNYGINYGVKKTADDDYWSRLMDQARLGAGAAAA